MHTPTRALALANDKARAARFGLYPICRATCRILCRVESLIPPRACNARSTVPIDTFAISAIRWIPLLFLATPDARNSLGSRLTRFVPVFRRADRSERQQLALILRHPTGFHAEKASSSSTGSFADA